MALRRLYGPSIMHSPYSAVVRVKPSTAIKFAAALGPPTGDGSTLDIIRANAARAAEIALRRIAAADAKTAKSAK